MPVLMGMGIGLRRNESEMHATTVAVDLAKSVFQIAIADEKWKVIEQQRLTRSQFERWFHNRDVDLVIMEACGSAHHWARTLVARGFEVAQWAGHRGQATTRRLHPGLRKTQQDRCRRCLCLARGGPLRRHRAGAGEIR